MSRILTQQTLMEHLPCASHYVGPRGKERQDCRSLPPWDIPLTLIGAVKERASPSPEPYVDSIPKFNSRYLKKD